MGEFIKAKIDFNKCLGVQECGGCIRVCPVNIFGKKENSPEIITANEDECTLCELCLEACVPGAIAILKLYEE